MSCEHLRDFEQQDGCGRRGDGVVQGSLHDADIHKVGGANLDALLAGVPTTHANVQTGIDDVTKQVLHFLNRFLNPFVFCLEIEMFIIELLINLKI